MHSTYQRPPISHMPCYPYREVHIPSPPDYYVLDLSTKTKPTSSPDYSYYYPSPKSSPKSNPSLDECDSSKCCRRSPTLDQGEVNTRIRPASCSESPSGNGGIEERLCYPLLSPRSPGSPGTISETTSEASLQSDPTENRSPKNRMKITRPFKRLAKDSLALSVGAIEQLDSTYSASTFIIDDIGIGPEETKRLMEESAKKYTEFREKMLTQLRNNNNNTNQNMRRLQSNGHRAQDPDYLEKRRKNNEAAKRSRDARRYKQDEIAIRATFLEQENIMLKYKVKSETEDLERLRKMEFSMSSQVPC